MTPEELARQIRTLAVGARKAAGLLAGEYASAFKGRGMEFDEVREYQPGDEIRTIDWNVTARTGTPHVKRYIEERDLTVIFVVDISASLAFGGRRLKSEAAAAIVALLAYAAASNNDRAGLLLFSGAVDAFVAPKKGGAHIMRLVREVLGTRPGGRGTDIGGALEHLGRLVHRRAVIFLLSDFLVPAANYQRTLAVLARRHDVVAISITDERERELPPVGLMEMTDAETGDRRLVDCGAALNRELGAAATRRQAELAAGFAAMGVEHLPIVLEHGADDEKYLRQVVRYFRQRKGR